MYLYEGLIQSQLDFASEKDLNENKMLQQRSAVMNRIVAYADSLMWCRDQKTREILLHLRYHNFDYGKTALEFNLDVDTIEELVFESEQSLELRVGRVFRCLLKYVDPSYVERLFEADTAMMADVFVKDIFENFDPEESHFVNLEDCGRELKFLCDWSVKKFAKSLKKIDVEKLQHLLYIYYLNEESRYVAERSLMDKCIKKKLPVKDALKKFKKQN